MKLSEMLGTIRKRLQSNLACIFALRIFDKGENGRYIEDPQEEGRTAKKTQENCQCLRISIWKDVAGP